MTLVLISSKAESDLESINDRMVSYSPQAANRLLDKILDKF
ncbi:type II toxin-antitoxin system RelE/ParE family toxin [Roseofilum sp. BLCC_M154]|uniref:Type II toxin-antitoxin system RelE/ParE family toxin n=1 Tax=Roseofilum acuticapitatum BLCC-M154 TaxID=3022444 RepID=A0ABT7AQ04_9CYAN|nr:type II toxin-antitoxin system RelE/ParE family toxin [Roseofilum acuticapitatum]MDJ1168529.1 type II toxin-antitoxin system RelE/ParE family toxin [Roseofilum acuticapitatum BLCC-M154]